MLCLEAMHAPPPASRPVKRILKQQCRRIDQ